MSKNQMKIIGCKACADSTGVYLDISYLYESFSPRMAGLQLTGKYDILRLRRVAGDNAELLLLQEVARILDKNGDEVE